MELNYMLILLGVFLSAKAEEGEFPCGYKFHSEAEGWFKLHREPLTWARARRACICEGAKLASPIGSNGMLDTMVSIMNASADHHVDMIHAKGHTPKSEVVQCIDAIPKRLALSAAGELFTVGQNDTLPFICYKKAPLTFKECGMFDYDNRTQRCYSFRRYRTSLIFANIKCRFEGAEVAVIDSAVEAQVIRDLFARNPAQLDAEEPPADSALIGIMADTKFNWFIPDINPLPVKYLGWAPGEPSNASGNERCGTVRRDGLMYDEPCHLKLPFICERRMKRPITCV